MGLPGSNIGRLRRGLLMADLPTIPKVQIDQQTPIRDWPRLINKIQENFIAWANKVALSLATAIGEVKYAYLTEVQFQQTYGLGWILIDGRDVTGSRYAALYGPRIPDQRGCVPRMKDNGRGLDPHGDLALGTYEADQYGSHTHTDSGHSHGEQGTRGNFNLSTPGPFEMIDPTLTTVTQNTAIASANISTNGGSETNAKSSIINAFIRIN